MERFIDGRWTVNKYRARQPISFMLSQSRRKARLGRRYSAFSRRFNRTLDLRCTSSLNQLAYRMATHRHHIHSFLSCHPDSHFYSNSRHSPATIWPSNPADLQLRPLGDIPQWVQLRAQTGESHRLSTCRWWRQVDTPVDFAESTCDLPAQLGMHLVVRMLLLLHLLASKHGSFTKASSHSRVSGSASAARYATTQAAADMSHTS
ncbi:hypothetical protein EDB89DRAFT_816584 [Lactarius sanguifluus]|nr:hypothetical protein EDB89DRAFT_816584 [Lactarius sanguifluus]